MLQQPLCSAFACLGTIRAVDLAAAAATRCGVKFDHAVRRFRPTTRSPASLASSPARRAAATATPGRSRDSPPREAGARAIAGRALSLSTNSSAVARPRDARPDVTLAPAFAGLAVCALAAGAGSQLEAPQLLASQRGVSAIAASSRPSCPCRAPRRRRRGARCATGSSGPAATSDARCTRGRARFARSMAARCAR